MRKLHIFLAVAAATLAAPAIAHPEDELGSPAQRGQLTANYAQEAVNKLVAQKKLPSSWAKATLVNFDFRTKKGVDQYVLTYENPAIKQPSKRRLFVVMGTNGEFISAGYKLI